MTDALIAFLNTKGFLPVPLPRTNLVPPDLYGIDDDHNLTRYGPLKDCLEQKIRYSIEESTMPDIEYVETTSKKLKSATKFLNDALNCIGLPAAPSLSISFGRSARLRFSFTGVTSKGIPPTKLFSTVGTLRKGAIPEKIIKEDKLHIAYTYLYANELIMQTADGTAFDANAASDLGNMLKADGRVKYSAKSETKLSFARADGMAVAFAYQAGLLTQRDGQWELHPGTSLRAERGDGETTEQSYYIPVTGRYLTLKADLSQQAVS